MFVSKIVNSRSINPNTMEYWDRCEVEVSLHEGDNPDEANTLSQNSVIKYQALMPKPATPIVSVEKKKPTGNLINDINSCTDLTVLLSYELLAKHKPELLEAYNKKYLELSKR